MTKATDLKTIIFEKPSKMDVETCGLFFAFFNPPSLAPKLYKLSIYFFFNELALKNWAMNTHFKPIHIP